jgi:molybdate transport system permease protein
MNWGLSGLGPLWLSLELAFVTTLILLVLCTPLAYRLAHSRHRLKPLVESVVALPLVLPPTVLGFYLLVLFNPEGVIGSLWYGITGQSLAFSFAGLVVASVIYSLPFVVQPLQNAFTAVGKKPLEAAYTLGARPLDAFRSVVLPLAAKGYVTAAVLGFAHTLGEFGVVLMVGGNIPHETRVVSIAIYDLVESMEYSKAHTLSGVLVFISMMVLLVVYSLNHRDRVWRL